MVLGFQVLRESLMPFFRYLLISQNQNIKTVFVALLRDLFNQSEDDDLVYFFKQLLVDDY